MYLWSREESLSRGTGRTVRLLSDDVLSDHDLREGRGRGGESHSHIH